MRLYMLTAARSITVMHQMSSSSYQHHQQQHGPLTVQLAELMATEALLWEEPTHPAHVVHGLQACRALSRVKQSQTMG
jgi:hypothetical protein